MSKNKIYIDTSVFSAFFDFNKPVRQVITEKWINHNLMNYEAYLSGLVLMEIRATPNELLRKRLLDLVESLPLQIIEITPEVESLAHAYRKKVIPNEINDSLHIASASIYQLDAIVSWNFKHIVNLKTIHGIHEVNLNRNLKIVEIVSPQNLEGDQYGSL